MQTYIFFEPAEEGVAPVSKQIASRLKDISPELRGPIIGIAIGDHLLDKESQLAGLVEELIIIDAPPESQYNMEVITNVLTEMVNDNGPGTLFLAFSHQGMELGPAVGWRLRVPVVTGCISLDWRGQQAQIKRNIFAGKVLLSSEVNMDRGAVISVQKGAWKDATDTTNSNTTTSQAQPVIKHIPWKESWAARKTDYINIYEEPMEGKEDITKAEILVSVGRGIGGNENLPMAKQLADELGGMLSCSRPVVDLGWLPAFRQVGISGKSVAPVIYLAFGISGQNNHLMGMDGSEIIIAINNDSSAPIFNFAAYGVVEDILDFIPELTEQAKSSKT